MKKYSFKRSFSVEGSEGDRQAEEETAHWEIIEEPLYACIEAIRTNFSPMYEGLLQEERNLVGNATLSRLPIERRESAILELVDFCIAGMMKSVSSNRAKRALETSKSRIHDILLESVVKMFDAVELDWYF